MTHPYYSKGDEIDDTNEDDIDALKDTLPDAPRIGWDYSFFGEQLELVPLLRIVNEHSYLNGPSLRKAWEGAVAQAALYPHLHQGVGVSNVSASSSGGGIAFSSGTSSSSSSNSKKGGGTKTSLQLPSQKMKSKAQTTKTTTSSSSSALQPSSKLVRKPAQKPTGPSYTADDFVWDLAKQQSSRSRSSPLPTQRTTTTTSSSSSSSSLLPIKISGIPPPPPPLHQPKSLRLRGEACEEPPDPSKLPVELRPTVWSHRPRKVNPPQESEVSKITSLKNIDGPRTVSITTSLTSSAISNITLKTSNIEPSILRETTAHIPSRAGIAATRTKRIGRSGNSETAKLFNESDDASPCPPTDEGNTVHQSRKSPSLFNPVSIWNTSPRVLPGITGSPSSPTLPSSIAPWGQVLSSHGVVSLGRKRSRPSDQAPELQIRKSIVRGSNGDILNSKPIIAPSEESISEPWSVGNVLKTFLSGGLR